MRYVSLCVKLHKWLTDNMEMAECGALNLWRSWCLSDPILFGSTDPHALETGYVDPVEENLANLCNN